ncbi:putative transcription factor WD40-like family [Dioscorea sansibarensis]
MFRVTGKQVSKLDYHCLTIRDCSWHPSYPTIVSSSWDGLVARWEFSGSDTDPSLVKTNKRKVSEDNMLSHIFL